MRLPRILAFLLLLAPGLAVAAIPLNREGLRPGPISVDAAGETLTVRWPDEQSRTWTAEFSLNPTRPLLTAVRLDDRTLLEQARPLYSGSTGKRRGGWDQFFDFPPSHPEGTRTFQGVFDPTLVRASTVGDRVVLEFEGLHLGIFHGSLRYTFYPGTRLLHQEAVVSTSEPDTAYIYDAGLRFAAPSDRTPGNNMATELSYFDPASGSLRTLHPNSSERTPVAVKYRALAARLNGGSVVVFPAPHQYFFPRDYTTNMGFVWHTAWRGNISLGIRQLPDDNSPYYPWINAPPDSKQHLGVFFLLSDQPAAAALDDVLRFTRRDRFERLPGYVTVAPHWHLAYTVQAMANGLDWTPPFKPVLQDLGIDSAIIMDFHGDGHPQDSTDLRLRELEAFYKACRAQSGPGFLLIPSEEANVYFGGHWSVVFPKPTYWFMKRGDDIEEEFLDFDPHYGNIYRIFDEQELLALIRREGGWMYQTHPRTKGSMGYPDKIRETEHFRDSRYLGVGWKAMNSDLSSPRLGDRSFNTLDDISNNWGLHKLLFGEVDVFQIDPTHELWGHLNINYVRLPRLPDFDHYGQVLETMARGDFFVSTGEVLLPDVKISGSASEITVNAALRWTFPLQMAEVIWGDGVRTYRQEFPLDSTRPFGQQTFEWKFSAPNWKWARLAVWDIATNGAFVNPTWK
jgi:hypothetical protein